MELGNNQVVVLRNGKVGVVASFNNKPMQLIFQAYTNPISRYDENLKNKNTEYDIVKVLDGSNVENVLDTFKRKFNPDELPVIWEATE